MDDDDKPKRYRVVGDRRLYIDKRWYKPGDVYEGDPHPALLDVRHEDRHLEPMRAPRKTQGAAKKASPKKTEGED